MCAFKKWPTVAIGDFTEVATGGTPSTSVRAYWENGTIPWLNSGELNKGIITQSENRITEAGLHNSAARLMPEDTVLIALTGATTGISAILKTKASANQSVTGILPSEKHDARFILQYLRSIRSRIVSESWGGAQKHISQAYVKELRVPLPPLEEQRRIAAVLDKADELRAKRRSALTQLDTLRQSIFINLFGDPTKNPKQWQRIKLAGLIITGPQNGLYKPAGDYGTGTPILRIDAFYDGVVTKIARLKRVRISDHELNLYGLHAGDIVVNRVNSLEYLGKSALIPELVEPTVFESNMMRFSVDRERIEPRYLVQFFQSNFVKTQIRTATKDAVNQSSINQQDVKGFLINVPPITLQYEFARCLDALEKLKATQCTSSSGIDALFASLQHRAFRGEL